MKEKIIFFIFVLVCFFLSFYKTESLFQLGYDQERDYQVIRSIVDQKHLTLLGPRVVSESGFYLGPWYYYLLVPFYVLLKGYPAFAAYTANLVTLVTALVLFYLISQRSSRFLGFLTALYWLSAPHRIAWNIMFIPLFSFILIHYLLQKPDLNKLFSVGLIFGLGLNFHPQMIFFLPSIIYYLLTYARGVSLRASLRGWGYLLMASLLPFLPLVVFDLRHSFTNINSLLHFASGQAVPALDFANRLLYSHRQFARGFGELTVGYHPFLLLTAGMFSLLLARKNKPLLALFLVPLSSLISLAFYRQPTWPEYYHLAGISVLVFLVFYTFWSLLSTRIVLIIIALMVIIISARTLLTKTDALSFAYQKQAINYILDTALPYHRPNITYDFPLGEGNGFGIIRDYYEIKEGPHNPDVFFVSYSLNPKQSPQAKIFGGYAVTFPFAPLSTPASQP